MMTMLNFFMTNNAMAAVDGMDIDLAGSKMTK
jgi:hypothetical protein